MKRDFLTVWDLSEIEIRAIIDRAVKLKLGEDRNRCPLMGKSVGLLFEKASTRTRVSFERGIYQLGAQAITMHASELQMGRGETIGDTAKTLSRYLDAIVIRTHEHSKIEDFASSSSIPV
ncbi:MAG TPA: ornithine carbamoyltransferase, partial [Thermodesulfovibrionales bacterium]|nr:ornithine carbamoyltransferase [Thermodesulfovibrionales bacterium]